MKIILKFIVFIFVIASINFMLIDGSFLDQIKKFVWGTKTQNEGSSNLYSLNMALNNLSANTPKITEADDLANQKKMQNLLLPKVIAEVNKIFKTNTHFFTESSEAIEGGFADQIDKDKLQNIIKKIDDLIASVHLIENFPLTLSQLKVGDKKINIADKVNLLNFLSTYRKYIK